jgi:GTP-binding protein EngB required for normal cell division
MQYDKGDIYLFYMNEELKMKNNQLYEDNHKYFLDLARADKKQSKFFIIDYDIHPEVKTKKEIKIQYYRNGKLVNDNLYQNKKESLGWCIAQSSKTSITLNRPVTATKLCIPCAGIQSSCPREKKNWKCEKCQMFIEYGYDNNFYCSCGGALAESYEFKCNSPLHPDEFLTFTREVLERYLPNKDAENEVNILLLGETGVGKSTFINALLNYLTYSSFEEAEKEELVAGIFTQFTLIDDNHMERTIKIGIDDNESTVVGQSSTQYAKAHVFPIDDDLTLRIIDTPGIGDTRGIEMDKQNLQNTLSYISNYGHLNGICILLKSNNAKLNVAFRYCIKELLTNLHRKATENIVFCFTNCRGTFYKPGDTLPALKTLLKNLQEESRVSVPFQSNIFCFDNESFRFLAALKQGVQFNDEDKSDFSKSWSRSVKMTKNMMDYILKCPIHKVKETVTLNEARSLIMELCKPIAEISQNIQLNIRLAQDKIQELKAHELSIDELKDKLNIPQVDLEPQSLDYPRTVCTQLKCTKAVKFNNIVKTDYVTHCHPRCYLKGVATDTINNSALRSCQAMANGICKVCGCSWTAHMHITYENKQVLKNVIDQNVQKMIGEKAHTCEVVSAAIDNCVCRINELKAEQKVIIEISAKFAHFTRKNAIAVFNDDLEIYLEHLIKEEEGKRSFDAQNSSIIDGLIDMKNNYKEQQRIFNEAASNDMGYNEVELSDISDLIKGLYTLKHNGATLKRIVDELRNGKCRALKFTEKQHDINRKKSDNKDNAIVAAIKYFWKPTH